MKQSKKTREKISKAHIKRRGFPPYTKKGWLYKKYITEEIPAKQIARATHVYIGTISKWLKKFNIPTRKRGEAIRNRHNPNWRGGRISDGNGYIIVLSPNHPHRSKSGYVREHRLVMEEHLGRHLEPGEIVHHIDGNRKNNKIENLLLTTSEKHKAKYLDGYKEGFASGLFLSLLLISERYNEG